MAKHSTAGTGQDRLRAFLDKHGITLAQAAEAVASTKASLSLWALGGMRPRHEWRLAIERWTRGAVPAASWLTADERRMVAGVKPYRGAR